MKGNHTAFWVGLVVVVSFGVAAAFFYMLSSGVFSDEVHYVAQFTLDEGVSGLGPGSDIRVGGVSMGTIERVEAVAPDDGPAVVRVRFPLPPDFPLYEGAQVSIGSSMTGSSWLNITDQGEGAKLTEGAVIDGESRTFGDMIERASAIMPRIESMVRKAEQDVLPKLEGGIAEMKQAAQTVDAAAEEARAVLAENRQKIDATLERVRSIAALIDDRAPTIASRVSEAFADAHAALTEATQTIKSLDPAVTDATEMLDSVHTVWVQNRGRVNDILQTVNRSAEDLQLTIQEFRQAPWRLLHRPEEDLQQYQPLYDAARAFSRGAADLQSAATSLKAAAQAKGVSESQVDQMLENLRQQAAEFERVQQAFFNELEAEVGE